VQRERGAAHGHLALGEPLYLDVVDVLILCHYLYAKNYPKIIFHTQDNFFLKSWEVYCIS
jgi:hypothetical protein